MSPFRTVVLTEGNRNPRVCGPSAPGRPSEADGRGSSVSKAASAEAASSLRGGGHADEEAKGSLECGEDCTGNGVG